MKVLHVMPEFPCPPDNGMRADMWDRLRAMSRLGFSIDVLVMKQKLSPEARHVDELRATASSLHLVERRPLRKCLATIAPTLASRNYLLKEFPLTGEYDAVVAEGEDVVPIFDNPRLRTRLRVLRIHNDETEYMRELARTARGFLRRQFLRLEALRLAPYSRYAYRRADSLWFISQSECRKFLAAQPEAAAKAVWLPPSIASGQAPRRNAIGSKRVLFVGSFHISLNQEAIRWYLNEVHPRLIHHPGYELVIAGSTQGRPAAALFGKQIERETRCAVHLDVEDLGPLYEQCAVFVNPMRRGAGVKLKSVHAIERGIPVVSTSVGNEGSGFADQEHVRVADTPQDFAAAVAELMDNQNLGEQMALRAHEQFRKLYDSEANIRRLFAALAPPSLPGPAAQDHVLPALFPQPAGRQAQ